MATTTFNPLLGKRIRVTALDVCGSVPAAAEADSWIATDGFMSVSLSTEVEDGTEIVTRKADNSLCVNEKFAPSFKRFNVEITFCGVNPDLLALVSNAEPYSDGTDVIGFTVPEGKIDKKFAFEMWTGLAGQACSTSGDEASGYLLLPFVQAGTLGNIEVTGESEVTFSITGAYTMGNNAWGKGPYKVVNDSDSTPSAIVLPTALDVLDHLLLLETDLIYPDSSDQLQAMPA